MIKGNIKVDLERLDEILEKRNNSRTWLAERMAISKSTLSKCLNESGLEPMAFRMMCMILGQSEEDMKFKEKPKVAEPINASSGIADSLLMSEVQNARRDIASLKEDLSDISKVITEMHKCIMEIKAQSQLNNDDISACQRKCVEINSTVNKISGHLNAKFTAEKRGRNNEIHN